MRHLTLALGIIRWLAYGDQKAARTLIYLKHGDSDDENHKSSYHLENAYEGFQYK